MQFNRLFSLVKHCSILSDYSLCQFYLLLWELASLMISKTNYQKHENHNSSHGNRLNAPGDHESRLQMWAEDIKIWRIREFQQRSVHYEYFVFDRGIDFLIECVWGGSGCGGIQMERYMNAKDGGSSRAFPFCSESPAGISLLQRRCLKIKQRVRKEWVQYKGSYINVFALIYDFFMIQYFSSIHPFSPPFPKLQLQPKRPFGHCWQSQRLGFFPPAFPDGFHDHAGLPGPVPSLLCLGHGAALAVLPRCRCRGYESGERRLLWHPVPARRPLPPGQTQTSPQHSPQLLIQWKQSTHRYATTSCVLSLTVQTLREEKW